MFTHIMIPLDGSSMAECVLPHAVAINRAFGCKVTLLRVLEHHQNGSETKPVDPLDWDLKRSEAQAYLDDVNGRLQELDVPAQATLVEGQAAETILDFVHKQGVDLIVVSSHGKSGLSAWNVSSVVQKVLLRAYVSTLVIRAYAAKISDVVDFHYRRIVVPLDGSRRSEWVLSFVNKLTTFEDVKIDLVHALAPPEMPRQTPLSQEDVELSKRVVQRNRQAIEEYFDNLRERTNNNVKMRLLTGKDVIQTLHEFVDEEAVDLVVVSAHGYSESVRWPYGSVTTSFIFHGTTPLLIIQDLPVEKARPSQAEIAAREYKGH